MKALAKALCQTPIDAKSFGLCFICIKDRVNMQNESNIVYLWLFNSGIIETTHMENVFNP